MFIFKIKNFLIKGLKKVWQNLFLLLAILLFLDLMITIIFFFKYSFQKEKLENRSSLKINESLMKNFSLDNQKREAIFQEAKNKTYPDIFNKFPHPPMEH